MTQASDIDRARIVVIGGGAVGCSILWHLARAGQTDAVLVEKHELTAGSTWHAAGNVPTVSNSWLGQRAGNYARRLYSELAADADDPITYRHTRAFWPGHTAERIDHFHHLIGIATGLGFDLRLVSPAEMEAMHPFWHDDGTVIAGLLDPYEGDIDPSGLTHGLARRARRLGARVRRHSRVVGIEQLGPGHDGDWRVHLVAGGAPAAIDCEIIVNAAGFYAAEIGRMAGVDIPLAVLEHQYLVTGPVRELAGYRDVLPLVRDPEIMFYLRREQDAFLFGSYGHEGRTVWETGAPDVFDSGLFAASTDDIAEVAVRAAGHVPLLGEAGIARFVNGPITYSPDANPLVGPVAGLDNFYLAAGVQIGITHAAAAGKALTEMITGGDTEWDMWPWDPRRFGRWALAGRGRRSYANVRVRELYEHQYAEPFPHRIWESARPVNRSPLYDTLAARGANFGQVAGWERAFWFSSTARYSHKDGQLPRRALARRGARTSAWPCGTASASWTIPGSLASRSPVPARGCLPGPGLLHQAPRRGAGQAGLHAAPERDRVERGHHRTPGPGPVPAAGSDRGPRTRLRLAATQPPTRRGRRVAAGRPPDRDVDGDGTGQPRAAVAPLRRRPLADGRTVDVGSAGSRWPASRPPR